MQKDGRQNKADRHDTPRFKYSHRKPRHSGPCKFPTNIRLSARYPATCLGTRALKLTQLRTLKNRSDCTISLQRETGFLRWQQAQLRHQRAYLARVGSNNTMIRIVAIAKHTKPPKSNCPRDVRIVPPSERMTLAVRGRSTWDSPHVRISLSLVNEGNIYT
jgi:hypothetical protein